MFAGFIVEPIQEKALMPRPDYLPGGRSDCAASTAQSSIVDRSAGRSGPHRKMFASEHYVSLRYHHSGEGPFGATCRAEPCSATVDHEKVFSSLDRCVVHSSNIQRNDLAMARTGHAARSLRRTAAANAAAMGELLANGLREVGRKYECFERSRQGLMIGIESVRDEHHAEDGLD